MGIPALFKWLQRKHPQVKEPVSSSVISSPTTSTPVNSRSTPGSNRLTPINGHHTPIQNGNHLHQQQQHQQNLMPPPPPALYATSNGIHQMNGTANGSMGQRSIDQDNSNHREHSMSNGLMVGANGITMANGGGAGGGNGLMSLDDLNGTMESQFSRNSQARMSLPVMHHKLRRQAYSQLQRRGQQLPQSLGHIYLQFKGETKQANLPNELTTIDTIRALFVCAFPHMLSMEYMCQPHVKIYIYNPNCNIFYELCEIDDVRHESVLRIHQSDPLMQISLTPQPLPMQHSMSNLSIVNHYATLHRVPSRVAPQLPPPPPPPIMMSASQTQQSPRLQQQQHQQQQQQQHQQLSQHHMSIPGQQHFLPQIPLHLQHQMPPPKPRRMLHASHSMHGLDPPQ